MRPMASIRTRLVLLTATLAIAGSTVGESQSSSRAWPGLWGPTRDGAAAPGTASPPRALKQLWRRPAAGGYSEIVAAGERAYTLEMRDGVDYVVAMDAQSGREQWRANLGPTYRGHGGSHDGPISTPAIDGGDLFALSPHGLLVAFDAANGRERWRHNLVESFAASAPVWGFASSPLVEGNLVLLPTGGEKSRGLLAFDRTTGRLAWSAPHSKSTLYSSAVAATLAGTRQIVTAAGDRVFAVSPVDGRLLWSVAGPGGGEEVNNSPLVLPDDRVLLTFWNEAVLLKISATGEALSATEVWRSPRLRGSQGPTIYRDGYLYGFAGAQLVCMEAASGTVRWRHRTYDGSLVGLGAHLLLLGRSSGELQVVRASPEGYSEVLRVPVFTAGATSITGPSVAGARVFLRNVEEMVAFRIEG
jgi:outer membrane protein assembly factor BamB